MLSGRSTVVAAFGDWEAELVLNNCRRRLGLADDGSTMELWHGPEKVDRTTKVRDMPGLQPSGEISEYQLLLRR
eukprot:356544-Amphidinium_carterae.1